jgi:hypothetical protein
VRKLLKMYLKELGWGEMLWNHLAQNRDQCRSRERDTAKTKRPSADLINIQ